MASVEIMIASRRYVIACRDGEEEHFRLIAGIVDEKARRAAEALGHLGETQQLLFASLLLADELRERRNGANPPPAEPSPELAETLERLAERVEQLADRLEHEAANP
jgi:cell division protein ZapA